MNKPITFLATFPPIQTAIKVSGDGGARIQLDVPETEMANAVELLALRGKVLRVTIETEEADEPEKKSRQHLTRFAQ